MQRRMLTSALLALALVAALAAASFAAPPQPRNFTAPLSGDGQIDPVETNATGVAHFKLSRDGDEMSFRVNVGNIQDVTMAHIHLEHSNGPVVVWLHDAESQAPAPIPGRSGGTLATGTITADDLVDHLAGGDLDALVDEIRAGNAWVNVHTAAHGGGEIAGQIRNPGGHIGGGS